MRTRLTTLALVTSVMLVGTAAFARQSQSGTMNQKSTGQSGTTMQQGSMHNQMQGGMQNRMQGGRMMVGHPTIARNVRVTMDGKAMRTSAPPVMVNGHMMLPMRDVFQHLGANLNWNASRQEVTATKGDRRVMLRVGDRNAEVNGRTMALDQAPIMYHNTVYVPLRAVGDAMGANVAYNASRREVAITTTGRAMAAAPVAPAHPAAPGHAALPSRPQGQAALPANARPVSGATIMVDGKRLSTADEPVMIGNTVMVPAQAVLQDLNAKPNWSSQQRRLTATHNGQRIVVTAGNRNATIGNRSERLSESPFVYRNQVYVPLDFIGRAVGGTATWEASRKEVVINSQARRAGT